jgi:hypothetical protein
MPAVRFLGLQSFVCQPTYELSGYSQHLAKTCFHVRRSLFDRPSPGSRDPGSFPHVLSPLRSSFASSSRPLLSKQPILPRFLPSSRQHRSRPLNTGASQLPLCSAHRLSQPLDGLLRLRLRGLIASHCHVQGLFRSGGSPDLQPSRLIAGLCPLAVTEPTAHLLGGLPRSARPTSRLWSTNRSVLRGWCLAFLSVAPLFGFAPPSGSSSPTVDPVTRAIRSWCCRRGLPGDKSPSWPRHLTFSVLPMGLLVSPSPESHTCSRSDAGEFFRQTRHPAGPVTSPTAYCR